MFSQVRECTWLGSTMCAACGGLSTWLNTWESRTLPDSMKRKDLPERVGLFFSYNRKALFFQIAPTNVQHCTWLGYRPPRPVGETGGRYHLGESEPQRLIFRVSSSQCATLYLVRILTAARCAGFRQAKSPGRVGCCRIPLNVAGLIATYNHWI